MRRTRWIWSGLLVCLMSCSDDSAVPSPDSVKAKDLQIGQGDAKTSDSSQKDGIAAKDRGLTCTELNAAYVKAVEAARSCNLTMSKLQCVEKVNTVLDCPCPTYVNPDNTEAVKTIKSLAAQWTAQSCKANGCSPVACKNVQQGMCMEKGGAGAEGLCKDLGAD